MFRIREEDGAVNGPKWEFSEGMPGPQGHRPTNITARYLNDLQNELANAVEASGQALDQADQRQLTKSIRRSMDQIVVGTEGHFTSLQDAVNAASPRTSIFVVSNVTIEEPITIARPFISVRFRWGVEVIKSPGMTAPHIFEVSANGFLLEGLHTEGFAQLVKFSTPAPKFAFIRNSTLKGGQAPTTGGTPQYLDLSTVVLY